MLFLGGNEHSVKVSSNSEMVRAGVPFENFGDYRELILSLISNYFCAFIAFVLLLYIFFQRFLKSQRGFSNAGADYTFNRLFINRVGFFLSINREEIRLFPLAFMRTNF